MEYKKLVSIIIPTFGRSTTLNRAIESVLKQSYKKVEIIVVDDNNPETAERYETENIMEQYQNNDKVIYLKHTVNKNGSAARNTGFRHSTGDYIMFLDDDDEFINDKIKKQVYKMESLNEKWGASYTGYVRKRNGEIIMNSAETREGYLLKEELMRNLFVHAGSNLMLKREVVEELDGFDESFERNQDIEFLTRMLMKYKLAYVDEIGLVVHVHDNRITKWDFEEITQNYLDKFDPVIKKMNKNDRDQIYCMINLQLFRHYALTSGKRIKAIKLIYNKQLSVGIILKYIFHLGRRFMKKEAYGFKM